MRIKPIGKRLIVERIEKDFTDGGIFLPKDAQIPINMGKVIESNVSEVVIGETVAFKTYAGQEIRVDWKELLIISVKDVLGILDEEIKMKTACEKIFDENLLWPHCDETDKDFLQRAKEKFGME